LSAEIGLLAASVPSWRVIEEGGVKQLSRSLTFSDFRAAMTFVNRVAELAESEGHHPDLLIRYNVVTISSWTHVARGLTENDFILASKVDALSLGSSGASG
jgi:4a-hydroxytetrahydrobiopterin dehydratase